ncbi:MAG: hypothetical protein JRI99_15220 [Deltaproteobacteria bacterium]|nr:hypothetical protein [Deltaproteobacteria bacterium]
MKSFDESQIIPGNSIDRLSTMQDYQADDLVCYCFEHTKHDIEQDFIENGRSLIMAKILEQKKLGGCQCSIKNPKGI